GIECLSVLENLYPDVILLDIMMPRKSGVEVLEEIDKNEELKKIPVIMVSAKTHAKEVETCLKLGAIDYIRKPFEEVELLARVNVAYQLHKKENHLRRLVSQKEDFVKMISHDLRSPFTTIQGFSELLLTEENIPDEHKHTLQYIIDSVNYSVEYFNKLLSWSKLEEGNFEIVKEKMDVAKILSYCVEQNKKSAAEKGIAFREECNTNDEIAVDDVFFKQTINNLISNAIKFTSQDGTIVLSAETIEGKTYIKIADNGVGMADEVQSTIFRDTVVKSSRGTSGEKGTGIGLFICKRICDAHGFDISVDSEQGKGTSFTIEIQG
ncbi:MAG: hybrid sensor histidine kinase/response regulator, partial [Bacteroidales bacterium]|nr:hybrid sensor histidine kinase/response regulator [Bacteroidales bacterium]